jgi:hypothetical protein
VPSAEPPLQWARVALAAASAVTVAIGVAACGDASGVPVETWRAEAEQVCADALAEAEALRPVTGYTTAAGPLRAAAERAKTQRDDTRDLGTPVGLEDETDDYLEALDLQAEALDELAALVLDDPTAATGPSGVEVTVANRRVDDTATALGLPGCTTQAATATGGGGADPGAPQAEPGLGDGGTQEG